MAIPAGRNIIRKETEKKLKYKSVCTEIHRMWNMKCVTVAVVTVATGILTKVQRNIWKPYQENIQYFAYKRQLYLEHYT